MVSFDDDFPRFPGVRWERAPAWAVGRGHLGRRAVRRGQGRASGTGCTPGGETVSRMRAVVIERTGGRVAWLGVPGRYASRVAAPRELLVPVPDGVGRATSATGLTALRPTGRMVLYGAASGQPEPFVLQELAGHGSRHVQRPTLATYPRTPQMLRERAGALLAMVVGGEGGRGGGPCRRHP